MKYLFSDIATIVGGEIIQLSDDVMLTIPLLDSRHVRLAAQSVFFALPGKRRHGRDFIPELVQKGVRSFIIDEPFDTSTFPDCNFVQVSDCFLALQALAIDYRERLNIPFIGITGSYGKTLVKEWLASELCKKVVVGKSPKSYNSQIGVPLSVLQIPSDADIAIIEAGISQVDEMDKLAKVIQPTLGIFTNIGQAHQEGFTNDHQKIKEKSKLFHGANGVIFASSYTQITEVLENNNITSISWGKRPSDAFCYRQEGNKLHLHYAQQDYTLYCPNDIPAYIFENGMHVITAMLRLGYDIADFDFNNYGKLHLRMEMIPAWNDCLILHDAYTLDDQSLALALAEAQKSADGRSLTLILTAYAHQDQRIDHILPLLKSFNVQKLYLIDWDEEHTNVPEGITTKQFSSVEDFIAQVAINDFDKEIIVLKGARRYQLERVIPYFQKLAHSAVLRIDLSALSANLKTFESFISSDCKIMAMVKANAYGAGDVRIAHYLAQRGIDYFGVAYTDEGIQLRKSGIVQPIMVMNPDYGSFANLLAYNLEPEIYAPNLLEAYGRFVSTRTKERKKVHIMLDTGMHRLGFQAHELASLLALLDQFPCLEVASIFTHLAASDDPADDAFTRTQFQQFDGMYAQLVNHLGYKPIAHVQNSHGIIRFANIDYDMVRLGIGLYGMTENLPPEIYLKPVHQLTCKISQIKKLKEGDTIGYGRSGTATANMTIATISIGYADGLMRSLSNGQYSVLVHGVLAPTIGKICMDMTMIDISHIPQAKEGDEVIVFGENHSLKTLAQQAKTIPYEILTNISTRVKRVYVQD